MNRIVKSTILIAFVIVFSMPRIYASPNMGAMDFVTSYNRFADYLAQQPNGSGAKNISYYEVKISSFMKTDTKHMYCGMLSDGITIYLQEDNYGDLSRIIISYSLRPSNQMNVDTEMQRRGELLGSSIALSLVTIGVPYNQIERDFIDIMKNLEKSWRDTNNSYTMSIYNPSNGKNMIFASGYEKESQRFLAGILYK